MPQTTDGPFLFPKAMKMLQAIAGNAGTSGMLEKRPAASRKNGSVMFSSSCLNFSMSGNSF